MVKKTWTRHRVLANIIPIGNALIGAMKRPRLLASSTLIGVAFWLLSTVNYYVYAQALGVNAPFYFYFVAIPIASLVAFLPVTINGFGLRESAFVYIFATVHVPAASSLLLALLMDVQVLFFGAIGGLLYLTMRSDDRAITLQRPGSNQGWRATTGRQDIVWFTKEEQDVFDAEALVFDDTTPTLPMLLVKARAAKKGQSTTRRGGHKEVIGKNKRIKLIRNEKDVQIPTIDEGTAPATVESEPSRADKFVSRGL
jgi:hypothetical protein